MASLSLLIRRSSTLLTHAAARAASTLPPMPKFSIVDSTLREGEQFATAQFGHHDRIYIAKTLDQLGVEYIELVNPMASSQAAKDCEAVANLDLKGKVLTHVRCHMDDVRRAVNTGVDGVNMYMATSRILREHSHGKGIEAIIDQAKEVIRFVQDHDLEVRFSCEDTFRSDMKDVLAIYKAVDALGVDRVGIADTVGIATPSQVHSVVSAVRAEIKDTTGIEFHAHDDVGCCIANALSALEAGATHIDTCVLGIGERNGITPLGGFLARMYTLNREEVMDRYNLSFLKHLERYVAVVSGIAIPFNNYVTGTCAFTHKAGVHSKAVTSNPEAYEILNPEHFGVKRNIQIASRLTGWNAIAARAQELGLQLSTSQIKTITGMIKEMANDFKFDTPQIDEVLKQVAKTQLPFNPASLAPPEGAPQELKEAADAAAKALGDYDRANTLQTILGIIDKPTDMSTPTRSFRVQGHLFDHRLLNFLCDAVVDSTCDFEVERLDVGVKNEYHSSAVLRCTGPSQGDLDTLKVEFEKIVAKSEGSVLIDETEIAASVTKEA